MRVKICGITRPEDALAAESAGADAIGLNFAKTSKRFITLEQAKTISDAVGPFVQRVGIFVDSSLEEVLETAHTLRLHAVQLHGDEDEAFAKSIKKEFWTIKAVSFTPALSLRYFESFPADAFLLDGLKPGSGERFDWSQAAFLKNLPHLILAGGLNVHNVTAAIEALQPYAVDLSSGVEARPGIKDPQKIQDFVRVAKFTRLSTVIHSPVDNCG